MPIDRIIERTDPNLQRVDPSGDRGGRGRQQEEKREEKDKFQKKPSLLKRLFSSETSPRGSSILTRQQKKPSLSLRPSPGGFEEEEKSQTLTERILVLWGVVNPDGEPRVGVIVVYLLVVGVIVAGTFLIIQMSLW